MVIKACFYVKNMSKGSNRGNWSLFSMKKMRERIPIEIIRACFYEKIERKGSNGGYRSLFL